MYRDVDPIKIIQKYAPTDTLAYNILITHSMAVRDLVLKIADKNKHLAPDTELLALAAMLHDIGITQTLAPDIGCFGRHPYICHGYLGREILEREGLPEQVALFAERHTGTGIPREEIVRLNLPLPHRDMMPLSVEEKMLCYADKFFSKSGSSLTKPKKLSKIYENLSKYGEDNLRRFDAMIGMFGMYYVHSEDSRGKVSDVE
ncbi:MAG: HDIG domain-containing protein [Bacteroidales bacterium]|jgi:uncharacterized protein|nr:HDIG domain-containing protein [Bacteroidales bacterium]MDY0333946.1 HDIG domain-containing protein [Bacteroidales bacterium]NLO51974.1 HDIG domain-containing protein [Bacteroidales bacterium]